METETLAHPFDAHFDSPNELQGWKDDFVEYYLDFAAAGEEDPLGRTLDEFLAVYEWDVKPTRADLERWYTECEADIQRRLPSKQASKAIETTVEEFHRL